MRNNFLCSILVFLVFILIYVLLLENDNPKYVPGLFSTRIEKIRTFGLNERPSEIRKAVEVPEWLKSELDNIVSDLRSGIDSHTSIPLTDSQVLEIISTIGEFGTKITSATSSIVEILSDTKYQNNKSIIFEALLSISRIKSSEESIPRFFNEKCESDSEDSIYYCGALKRLKINLSEKAEEKLSKKIQELSNINIYYQERCLFAPLFKEKETSEIIKNISDVTFSHNSRRQFINCSKDILNLDKEREAQNKILVKTLSDVMQYDKDKVLRRESLLTLLQSGREDAISQVKGYGHKFINGEAKSEEIMPHPFIQWSLETKGVFRN